MIGNEAFLFSITIAASSSASFVHAPDPSPNNGKQVGNSSWMESLKGKRNWAACFLACNVLEFNRVCVDIGGQYATFGTRQYACFKDLCEHCAEMIYEEGSCDSKIGSIKVAEYHKRKQARLTPVSRERPVFKDHSSGKQ